MASVKGRLIAGTFAAIVASLISPDAASAQELEARAFSAAPDGTRFVFSGFGHSDGAYVLDPNVPIGDVEADINYVTLGGGYVFDVFGRQARVLAVLPYAWGEIAGDVSGVRQSEPLQGLVDPRIKFTIGLAGAPALSAQNFAQRSRTPIVAASLTIVPPLGQYNSERLVNLGYNRWAFKPEIGVSRSFGNWTLEGSAGVWLYTDNDDYQGRVRRQDPIGALQLHIGHTFDNGAWLAGDVTWFSGGQTTVNGIHNDDAQDNARAGLTLSWPLPRGHSLKFTYSSGLFTRRGSDFDSFAVTWQHVSF